MTETIGRMMRELKYDAEARTSRFPETKDGYFSQSIKEKSMSVKNGKRLVKVTL